MIKLWIILAGVVGIMVAILLNSIMRMAYRHESKQAKLVLTCVVASCLVGSLLVYHFLGSSEGVAQKVALDQEINRLIKLSINDQLPENKMLLAQASIIKLKDRIMADHRDQTAWYLLGQMYGILNQWNDAVDALNMAKSLAPQDLNIQNKLEYALKMQMQMQPDQLALAK